MTNPECRNPNDEAMALNVETLPSEFWTALVPVGEPVVRENGATYGKGGRTYDLEERTARFGESIIQFLKTIPHGPMTNRLIDQLLGAATSVGANYCEADDAVSKRDFRNRIGTCRKESRETKFFLRMIASAVPEKRLAARELWREAHELNLIFGAIFRNTKPDAAASRNDETRRTKPE